MDTRDYQYVLTIAETKSFSRAAEKLFLAQPYLSKFISNLERNLGVRLFDRSKTPLVLTENGRIFAEYAQQMLDLEDAMQQELSAGGSLHFSIGATTIIGRVLFPKVLPALLATSDKMQILSMERSTTELEELVYQGKLHMALLSQPTRMEGLQYELLQSHRLLVVIPAAHPLYRREDAGALRPFPHDIAVLRDQRYVLPSKKMGLRRMVDRFMFEYDITPHVSIETSHYEQALQISEASGTLLTFIAEYYKHNLRNPASDASNYYYFETWPQVIKMFAVYRKRSLLVERCIQLIQDSQSGEA